VPSCIGKPGQPPEYKDGFLHGSQAQDISLPHIPAEVFGPCGEALGPTSLGDDVEGGWRAGGVGTGKDDDCAPPTDLATQTQIEGSRVCNRNRINLKWG